MARLCKKQGGKAADSTFSTARRSQRQRSVLAKEETIKGEASAVLQQKKPLYKGQREGGALPMPPIRWPARMPLLANQPEFISSAKCAGALAQ